MRKMLKILLYFLALILLLGGYLGLYFYREIGSPPSDEELKQYSHLPYFKNGRFTAWRDTPYYPDKTVGKGVFGQPFSPNRPPQKVELVNLTKADFAQKPDKDFAYYWLGHSTTIIELAGMRFLNDPVFKNAAPLPFLMPRYQKSPLALEQLPDLDFVLISHDHYDHLERRTIQKLKDKKFIVPLGLGSHLKFWGVPAENIKELGWGDSLQIGALKITAEKALHYSGRTFGNRNRTLWASYVIESPNRRIFISGDNAYDSHFAELGEKYKNFDLAIIEIDAGNQGWPHTHQFPEQAVQSVVDLKAQRMLPVHWAVFDMALNPYGQSINRVIKTTKKMNLELNVPKMGEKYRFGDNLNQCWWIICN